MICEWNLLFWRPDLAYFREKRDSAFDGLAGPVTNKMIQLVGHKISNGSHKQIIATPRLTHLLSN